jgi:8-oxo-dGTP pyrophosphatase MutT (NUDIX family)
MTMSKYLRDVRAKVGHDLLVMPSVTGFVFDDAGRLLLVRHATGQVWVAPGGAVDPDESPVDAVVRELWEETGLHVEPVGLYGVFGGPEFRVSYANGDEVSYVMAVFRCDVRGGTLRVDGVETLEARWVPLGEVGALRLGHWVPTVLPAVTSGRVGPTLPPVAWRPPRERGR